MAPQGGLAFVPSPLAGEGTKVCPRVRMGEGFHASYPSPHCFGKIRAALSRKGRGRNNECRARRANFFTGPEGGRRRPSKNQHALNRRQHGKAHAASQRKLFRRRLALVDAVDARPRWPAATSMRDRVDRRGRSREHRLDRAVAPVTDPAAKPVIERGILHEGAVANSLNAAAYDE